MVFAHTTHSIILSSRMAKFLVFEKGANPNLISKKFPYTLIAQAMPYQYEPDAGLIRFVPLGLFGMKLKRLLGEGSI